ncbi:lysophospholipase L1-like esterase [Nocardia transvalensis]|uniref:Lysophospholipase L1-like esterase n=1 Tax=Nocardia transvalensis TaxID=37333 RepID=A0A7W9P7Z6_9NOCA|nr:SGNH/GDSL hydrolase family protein [Nocardia transvalensis]MBB5911171.1 lysophospholipase L1-like esterase [Nocardia transvalensis]
MTRRTALALAALSGLALLGAGPAHADEPEYYLAVGDSLSVGSQPGRGPTDEGYPDRLYEALRERHPDLRLVKLGCGGETTTTMLEGGICRYPEGSQMDAAVAFLRQHAGRVAYVTLDMGANNTNCVLHGDLSCTAQGGAALLPELWRIAARLRQAGGDTPVYAAMTYYDPGLAAWTSGDVAGRAAAVASVPLVDVFNAGERGVYGANGFAIADVNADFDTHDFATVVTDPRYGTVPLNVARICAWTYQCSDNDGHATASGYRRIAETFLPVLTR